MKVRACWYWLFDQFPTHHPFTDVRVTWVRLPLVGGAEAVALVETFGSLVAVDDPQVDALVVVFPGPVEGRGDEQVADAPAAPGRLNPHADEFDQAAAVCRHPGADHADRVRG